MTISINQSFYQRRLDNSNLLNNIRIKPTSKYNLQNYLLEINRLKNNISWVIGYYLNNRQRFGCKLDLERKCRALGIPVFLSGINISNTDLDNAYDSLKKQLTKHTIQKNDKPSKHCSHDIRELAIYAKMYQEIEYAKSKHPRFYPHGNPFSKILQLINLGAVIIRFKYVKVNDKKPVEKLITYHLWSKKRLLIHIEGDNYFVGWKYWGEGDEKIHYFDDTDKIQIRWGIFDFGRKRKFRY